MSDIVERLRERAGKYDEYDWHWHCAVEQEAADEIERLRERADDATRAALRAGMNICDGCGKWHTRLGMQLCKVT